MGPRCSTLSTTLTLLLALTQAPRPCASATFTVDSPLDQVDLVPGDGVCSAASACTLRAAVMEANAWPGADTIVLPDGFYVFSIAGSEDAAAAGDLDVTSAIAITGRAANWVTIDASTLDRVFDVRPTGDLTLTGVSVVGGFDTSGTGGGIRNEGALALVRAEVRGNQADGVSRGGGLFSNGALSVRDSSIWDNSAGAFGGGVYATSGTFTNSAIFANLVALGYTAGAGIASDVPGGLSLRNCTIAENSGALFGGGVFALSGAPPTVRNSIIARNTAAVAPDCAWIDSEGYNLIQDPAGCTIAGDPTGVQTSVDPILLGPALAAGGVELLVPDESSTAVDAGNPAVPGSGGVACEERDVGGYPRALGGRCDLGAYETGHCWPAPVLSGLGYCREQTAPPKGLLMLRDNADDRRDALVWRWLKGESTDDSEIGGELSGWELCVYDDTGLVLEAHVPGGGTCGTKPCWTDVPTGLTYKNATGTADGMRVVKMKAGGDGQAKLVAAGKGAALRFLPPPWSGTVQVEARASACWVSSYAAPISNQTGLFKAKP